MGLRRLIPKDILDSLSPSQWEERQEQLVEDSKEKTTLFLFDKDLSDAGGDTEGGMRIIQSLLQRDDTKNLICGLLTHTVTPEAQPQQWSELSEKHGLPRDRFIVIPKLHLSKAPILFAQSLKFVALSPAFTELKNKTRQIMEDAANAAAERIDRVSIYDLDHIVFQVSAAEGLWEPDMLFRLHAMFHRLESRKLAHKAGELEEIAARLRSVSEVPTKCDLLPAAESAWALQREELYEPPEHLNRNHLPIELGDIFEVVNSGSKKKYILLAQPCDLMVRSSGNRAPDLTQLPLVEVVVPKGNVPKYSEELPYFDESPSTRWCVKLKLVHFVRSCTIDLCVFNEDGVARLTDKPPVGIRPAWGSRHEVLRKGWDKLIRNAVALLPQEDDPQAVRQLKAQTEMLLNRFFADDPFKGRITKEDGVHSVAYNCRRVGRLSRDRAIGLLMAYTSTLGRPAYDRDFGGA